MSDLLTLQPYRPINDVFTRRAHDGIKKDA
jgi:hypothetical protein